MATEIYKTKIIQLFDGTELEISPLKIKYLKEFMNVFSLMKEADNEEAVINVLVECARVCMKQHKPEIATSVEVLEEYIDLKTMYTILDVCAGIKIEKGKNQNDEDIVEQAKNKEKGMTWEELDLAKLEAEVFLVGNWKNFDELESSLCMAEISEILNSKRELDYEEKKFFAAIQGVDLDKESGRNRGQKEWEDMKARVFSRGKATDSDDVLSLQGVNAEKAGFGIGMGLDYEDLR